MNGKINTARQRVHWSRNVVQQPDNVGHKLYPSAIPKRERVEASSDSVAIYYTEALTQFLDERSTTTRCSITTS